jgi:hypothetical protein
MQSRQWSFKSDLSNGSLQHEHNAMTFGVG